MKLSPGFFFGSTVRSAVQTDCRSRQPGHVVREVMFRMFGIDDVVDRDGTLVERLVLSLPRVPVCEHPHAAGAAAPSCGLGGDTAGSVDVGGAVDVAAEFGDDEAVFEGVV